MSTITELSHYCKLNNLVGALLFTGEWGCGKTYTIEKELKELLKDSHIIIRVLLFGIISVFFSKLIDGLKSFCVEYSEQPFKRRFTEAFISVIDKLLEREEKPSEDPTDE